MPEYKLFFNNWVSVLFHLSQKTSLDGNRIPLYLSPWYLGQLFPKDEIYIDPCKHISIPKLPRTLPTTLSEHEI